MKTNKLTVLSIMSIIIILLMIITLLSCHSLQLKPVNITSTPIVPTSSKSISLNTLPLKEKWRWSGIVNNFSKSAITVTEKHVVIIEGVGTRQRIHVFDVHTGHSLWNSNHISNIKSIAADEKRVYIGTITDVQAFDLETGEKLWQGIIQSDLKRGGFSILFDENQIYAYDIIDPTLYVLDAISGHATQKIVNPSLFYRYKNKIDFLLSENQRYLEARVILTGEKLWGQQFSGTIIRTPPIFFDQTMILNIADQFIGLVGVDTYGGNVKWEISDDLRLIDVAILDNLIYSLRYDASIVGLDPKTGNQIGIIEMTPNRTVEDDGGLVTYYGIATSAKHIVVYYGNSQELIVFEKVEDSKNTTR